jgi:hypothetical protein
MMRLSTAVCRNGSRPISTTCTARSRSLRLLSWLALVRSWNPWAAESRCFAISMSVAVPMIRLLSKALRSCAARLSATSMAHSRS